MTLEHEVDVVMAHDRVLVGTDFDGVLAPIVETPDLAVPDPRAVALLTELAGREGVRVAVVSGRHRADLALRLGEIPGAVLVGEHGNDVGQEAAASPVLAEARALMRELRESMPAATVEDKPRSVTFHTRRLDRPQAHAARRALETWVDQHPGISLLEGKEVFELTVATRTKGDAIDELGRDCDATVFFGDDVTDESVFGKLTSRDLGIKVGPGETAARYRVDDVDGVVAVLGLMAAAAEDRGDGVSDG